MYNKRKWWHIKYLRVQFICLTNFPSVILDNIKENDINKYTLVRSKSKGTKFSYLIVNSYKLRHSITNTKFKMNFPFPSDLKYVS